MYTISNPASLKDLIFLSSEWFENQLMPALKNPSLVVLDNASYHNVKTEDTVCPNFSQKKAVLQNYLTSLASFNRKVVLFLATKPLTCAHINSIGFTVSNGGS
jgi:hypothetical protein